MTKKVFSSKVKRLCWARAEPVPGRDPIRWRKDAVGNIVGNHKTSVDGIHDYSFDPIIPFSKGGKTVADNCQLLQTRAHMWKVENNNEATKTELADNSYANPFSDEALDGLEMFFYGNVVRAAEDGRAHLFQLEDFTVSAEVMDNVEFSIYGNVHRISKDGTTLVRLPGLRKEHPCTK